MSLASRLLALPVVAVLMSAATPSMASYSGLALIPTADTVGSRAYCIEPQVDGSIPTPDAGTFILNTEFGLGDRAEAGVDVDMSQDANARLLINAKYVVARSSDGRQGVAFGVFNVGTHQRSSPYIVGSQDLGPFRGHLGAMHIDGKRRWLTGIDRAISEHTTLMADYISGDENYSSIAVGHQWTEGFGITAGIQFPNGGGESLYTLHLVITGKIGGANHID